MIERWKVLTARAQVWLLLAAAAVPPGLLKAPGLLDGGGRKFH